MNFRIADTFTDSLAKLTGEEQKLVKTTAFDLQLNPAHPGLGLHKLDRSRDKHFWSVRVGSDLRLIVHKTDSSFMLCYVDHHDKAYAWAERRRLEVHPNTGAAQWVEVRERVEEVLVQRQTQAETRPSSTPSARLFAHLPPQELLRYGVPEDLLPTVLHANEDSLLALAEHLPAEAAEALLTLATGGQPQPTPAPAPDTDPFAHPDAQRRFRVMRDVEELAQALDFPWDKWLIFLHPAQRQWVEKSYAGPARISGSAGTGKTIVALHRAVFLARQYPEARVLLTTFSTPLAQALHAKLRRLIAHEPVLAERLEVAALDSVAQRLHERLLGKVRLLDDASAQRCVAQAAQQIGGHRFSDSFICHEWLDVVDSWQLNTWESYRDFKRLGRKTRLTEAQRQTLWRIFEAARTQLNAQGGVTRATLYTRLAEAVRAMPHPPYEHIVIDEAQDVDVGQLRLLAALAANRPDGLMFTGDLGQRIFQTPFSWKSLGVDVRGRSRTLSVNYRTSHQIRAQADRLLDPEVSDVDGNVEERQGTVSVFNGPAPQVHTVRTLADETTLVAHWIQARLAAGVHPHELGLIVRSAAQFPRAEAACLAAGLRWRVLDEQVDTVSGQTSLCSMPVAKGLEFRCVVVMACDDEVIPQQTRIESVTDDTDLDEVYHTERHLLYVACTRARDHLLVTALTPGSEFLGDLQG